MPNATVYVLACGEEFKIGRSRNVARRMKELQTGQSKVLRVVYQLDTPESAAMERYLQRFFRAHRLRGEWFALSPDHLAFIETITAWPCEGLPEPPKLVPVKRPVPPRPPRVALAHTPAAMLLQAHGVNTIAELCRRSGLSRQHAWNLWHGQFNVGRTMAFRLCATLGIPLRDLISLERLPSHSTRLPGRPPHSAAM